MSRLAVIVEGRQHLEQTILPFIEHHPLQILLELRLDLDLELLDVLKHDHKLAAKSIVTLRSEEEGGKSSLERAERHQILREALVDTQARLVDLELKADAELLQEIETKISSLTPPEKRKIIVSRHHFKSPLLQGVKEYIEGINSLQLPLENEKIVYKFVGAPRDTIDMILARNLMRMTFNQWILLGTGINAELLRYLGRSLGQYLVYGTLESPHEMTIPSLRDLLEVQDDSSLFAGLIGSTLTHSLSPLIHQLFREELNIPGHYFLLEVKDRDQLGRLLLELKNQELAGVNVTFPYKDDVVLMVPSLSLEASLTGAVNAIHFTDDGMTGHNTDVTGFYRFFRAHGLHGCQRVLIFGAGGAARAVVAALLKEEMDIVVVNRSTQRLVRFPAHLRRHILTIALEKVDELVLNNLKPDIYVNATTLGLHDEDPTEVLPIPDSVSFVMDLTYQKERETILVKKAKKMGLNAWDGKEMLFHQAADAFEIWSGKKINRERCFRRFLCGLTNVDNEGNTR